MDIYQYIAEANEYNARAICNKWGITLQNVQTPDQLAACLKECVAEGGQEALVDIADVHPDKSLIVELFGNKQPLNFASTTTTEKTSPCSNCQQAKQGSVADAYIHAASQNTGINLQTGVIIFGMVTILCIAAMAAKR